jgi:hypothetical protein
VERVERDRDLFIVVGAPAFQEWEQARHHHADRRTESTAPSAYVDEPAPATSAQPSPNESQRCHPARSHAIQTAQQVPG